MKRTVSIITTLLCLIVLFSAVKANADNTKRMRERKTLGVLLNYNKPRDSLDKNYDSDMGVGIKAGYGLTDELGVELAFTSFSFDGKKKPGAMDDLTIDCFRANAFYRFITATNLYPFATAGLGYYMMDEGPDDFGINFGVGIITDLVDLHDMFSFDLSWNYHRVNNDGKDAAFFEIRAGLNFNFY